MCDCQTCGKKAHNFEREEPLQCVPPKYALKFGSYEINPEYREALYDEYPFYTTEEVVGSYLGYNPYFPSQLHKKHGLKKKNRKMNQMMNQMTN